MVSSARTRNSQSYSPRRASSSLVLPPVPLSVWDQRGTCNALQSARLYASCKVSSESKKIMETAGVPVVPGYHGENQDPDFLLEQAKEIGGCPWLVEQANN